MSERPHVYLTRRLPQAALDLLALHVQLAVWPGELPPPRAVLLKELARSDGLLCLPADRLDAAALESAPYLRAVSTYGLEIEQIDMAAATRRGVLVTNTPDVLTETVADFAFALILAAARRIVECEQYVKAGRWRSWGPELLLGRDVYGATLGIVGMGRVGQALARRAAGFGMRIVYTGPRRKPEAERATGACWAELRELIAQSDIVSLHCPLNDETYHLLDRDTLALLKPNAILVNTAHGLLVDTRALAELLRTRPIIAALDVTDPEPLPANHALLSMLNVLVTPHVASATALARTRMALMAAQNLVAALEGERPPCLVNTELWESRVIAVGAS
ncbi:MAG: D-glycerate dehydrogenase [Kouleothrix sp.]|jgi:glyoxylate reductase|nr:D-glycerate dehydrogenase [Kouleothrix sp.]